MMSTYRTAFDGLLYRLGQTPLLRFHRLGDGHGEHEHDHADGHVEDFLATIRNRAASIHETVVHDHDVRMIEFMGSTGGGKTELIERLLERRPPSESVGVIVGDVAGDDDARRFEQHGVEVINVNTGKECHLEPGGLGETIESFDLKELDTLYVENVGNMVCPADFPLGASNRVLVVSTTEGDDVVRKHPLLVQQCDIVVVNKVDLAEAVGADLERLQTDIESIAPEVPVIPTTATTAEGIDALEESLFDGRHVQTQ